MRKRWLAGIFSFMILFSTCVVCSANQVYVGQDEDGSDYYFFPNSVEILSSEEKKFIFTVLVKEVLSKSARQKMYFSDYDNGLCYPYPANLATEVAIKYRYKITPKKIQFRQELYFLYDKDGNIIGADTQTKYYHECKSNLMTFSILKRIREYYINH